MGLEQFIERAAELGFEGVMLGGKRPHLSVLDWGPGQRARLREQIERRGMRRVCVAAYTNFTADLEHAEIPQREFQIHYVTALAEFARDLGGDLVRVFTGYENPAAEYGRQWTLVVETLRECARRAAQFGVTIGRVLEDCGAKAISAVQICVFSALAEVPTKVFTLQDCFSALKNSSICQRFL